jgi:tetratricopeptide (TPR) repeat protein
MQSQWCLNRFFTLLLCWGMPVAWADATSDIETLIQDKQWPQAEQRIRAEMQKSGPSAQSPQWRLMASQVGAAQGKTEEAIQALQALIQEFPELPEPYNNLGVLLAAQGQFDAAATALRLAVQARPNYIVALQNLGDLYNAMAQQAYDKAKTLKEAKGLLPLPSPAAATSTTTNTRSSR